MAIKMRRMRQALSTMRSAEMAMLLSQRHPVFELFYWRRIVMDEFHESESWVYRVREMFKSVGADHRWGLSGTPPVGNRESIAQVAQILWYTQPVSRPRAPGRVAAQARTCAVGVGTWPCNRRRPPSREASNTNFLVLSMAWWSRRETLATPNPARDP